MRKNLLNILLFFTLFTSAQTKTDTIISEQRKYLQKGIKSLGNSNMYQSILDFHYVVSLKSIYSTGSDTYESIARKKMDSLLPIFRKKEAEKWKGRWKLKYLSTKNYNYEYLEIRDKEILFYDEHSTLPVKIEKIKYAKYDDDDLFTSYTDLEFSDSDIWEFSVKKVRGEKRLLIHVQKSKYGEGGILLDERHLIKDPKKRKEALAKEIKTYYILEK